MLKCNGIMKRINIIVIFIISIYLYSEIFWQNIEFF